MTRLTHAWRALKPEQRLAALAALGLFASMFLPWYSKTDTVVVHSAAKATATSLSAFQAFSFVEAAVLLVSAGVLAMLFARAEGRRFQLPGGDGLIVMVAGGWTALLVFYRLLDKPALQGTARITATVGVEWGIFIALLLALGLLYAGGRMRAVERPEPPLRRPRSAPAPAGSSTTGEPRADAEQELALTVPGPAPQQRAARERSGTREPPPTRSAGVAGESTTTRRRPPYPPAPPASSPAGEQLSFEDPPTRSQ